MQRSCREDAVRDVLDLMATYTVMALGLVAAIIGVRNYGSELTNIARESSAGVSLGAYFLGKSLAELPLIILYSFLYCVSYYLISSPASHFSDFFTILLLFEFAVFGVGHVSSLLFRGENALLCAAISALLGGLATNADSAVKDLCWARWAAEALWLSESRTDLLQPPMDTGVNAYMEGRNMFKIGMYSNDIAALFIFGIVLRLIAFALMYRKFKQ